MTDKNTADKHAIDNNVAQGIAAYIDYLNQLRVSTLMDTLRQILNNETGQSLFFIRFSVIPGADLRVCPSCMPIAVTVCPVSKSAAE